MKVLYIVVKNTTTSVPLEAAGKIQELAQQNGIDFSVATYYRQPNPKLRANFVKDLIELNFRFSVNPLSIYKYYKFIKRSKANVVHLHHGVSAFQGALIAKLTGVKTVIKTEHNDHRHYKWYQKILTVPVFLFADRIICNSYNTQLSFYAWEKAIAGSKSTFIYNGINTAHIEKFKGTENAFAVRQKFGLRTSEKLLVSVGRLIPQKNYSALIKAFTKVAERYADVQLIIAGGGPEEEKLSTQIKESGMDKRVRLLGMIQRDEVYQLVNAADAFVIASRWEGFCNAVVEAMAAGKPIISSDIATLREVVGTDCGRFFDPQSTDSIADTLTTMLTLPNDELNSMSEHAQQRAAGKFSLEACADNYLNEYFKHS